MPESIVYTAVVTSTGEGRNGHVRSSDGIIDVDVRTPKEMGGSGGATNPEQLFAAGYAACFHSALKLASKHTDVPITDSAVTADVDFGPNGSGGFELGVTLHVELGGVSQEEAEKLAQFAHSVCPYSNATRGNIDVKLEVETA